MLSRTDIRREERTRLLFRRVMSMVTGCPANSPIGNGPFDPCTFQHRIQDPAVHDIGPCDHGKRRALAYSNARPSPRTPETSIMTTPHDAFTGKEDTLAKTREPDTDDEFFSANIASGMRRNPQISRTTLRILIVSDVVRQAEPTKD